jgi:hypothetical protein
MTLKAIDGREREYEDCQSVHAFHPDYRSGLH